MDYVEIAKTDEIWAGNMKAFVIQGKDILVANHEGKYYAIDNECTHMKGELAKGKIEGKIVTCPGIVLNLISPQVDACPVPKSSL